MLDRGGFTVATPPWSPRHVPGCGSAGTAPYLPLERVAERALGGVTQFGRERSDPRVAVVARQSLDAVGAVLDAPHGSDCEDGVHML